MRTFHAVFSLVLLISSNPAFARKPGKEPGRPKHVTGEVRGRGNKFDFEEADIRTTRKGPIGTEVTSTAKDNEHDFVKLRLRWHPEMIASAASLAQ